MYEHNQLLLLPYYLKEMIEIGFQFTSLLSDFRIMSSHAENLLKQLKDVDTKSDNTSAY